MGNMKAIFTEIMLRYPDKKTELYEEFMELMVDRIKEPRSKELKQIMKEFKEGKL